MPRRCRSNGTADRAGKTKSKHPVGLVTAQCGRPLELGDGSRIAGALSAGAFSPAEYAFANLWLFRERHDYRLCEDPVPHIRGTTYDGQCHALPLVPWRKEEAEALFRSGAECLYPIGAEGPDLAARFALGIDHRRADSDYWFEASAMARLSGARTRRQQAASFESEFRPRAVRWEPSSRDEALDVLEGWERDTERMPEEADGRECREALELSATLGLEGLLIRTDAGEAAAFLLASRAGDAAVIHFAKGRRAFSHAYPWMFAHYAGTCGAAWLNFEQDLGRPGFAQAKRAYAPTRHEPKFRLFPKSA